MPHILEWKRVIELCGTNDFVPQAVYQPYTEADRKRYIRDVELLKTIFFQSNDSSELGVSLEDALQQRLRHLKDKDDRMFVGCGPSVSIRIQARELPRRHFVNSLTRFSSGLATHHGQNRFRQWTSRIQRVLLPELSLRKISPLVFDVLQKWVKSNDCTSGFVDVSFSTCKTNLWRRNLTEDGKLDNDTSG